MKDPRSGSSRPSRPKKSSSERQRRAGQSKVSKEKSGFPERTGRGSRAKSRPEEIHRARPLEPTIGPEGGSGRATLPTSASTADELRDERVRARLLAWFAKEKRDLPFRASPSAYGIWVSEVMLQQTRVATVIDYYTRFLERFPKLESLARAEEAEVLRLWQGLGYYSRARRLHQGAKYVVEHLSGRIPSRPEELLRIPGIGPYTAGAIASIAFGERAPLVDGNVIRVLSRLDGIYGDPKKAETSKRFWQRALELLPAQSPGDFNQALMELGATVCTPRSPICLACPLNRECFARRQNEQENLPQLPARRAPEEAHVVVLLMVHRGRVLLEQLPINARWWAGLSTLPCFELGEVTQGALSRSWAALASGMSPKLRAGVSPQNRLALVRELLGRASISGDLGVEALPSISHPVTRFRVIAHPFLIRLSGSAPRPTGHHWATAEKIAELGLPAPHRKLIQAHFLNRMG